MKLRPRVVTLIMVKGRVPNKLGFLPRYLDEEDADTREAENATEKTLSDQIKAKRAKNKASRGSIYAGREERLDAMYGLPPEVEALPPMPEDGGHWTVARNAKTCPVYKLE
ncbi:hypothetical protein C5167_017116 [Papaver somniferum]|uniref:Uncharacterized protein n=1 Tax=Papaver somniferum TaxID=3469 RepID=A0A4Y7ILM9_PAPSO|nr:hypothetical protein C5167_017116 [Papaver somniferum]